MLIDDNDNSLVHYGVKRRSGRYPYGSGDEPYQHSGDFLARYQELTKNGMREMDVAKAMGLTTTDLRMQVKVAKHDRRRLEADRARSLREDGKSLDEIASIMGYANDSSIRALLNENTSNNKNKAVSTAEALKKELEEKGMIDVGLGAEKNLGVSQGTLKEALFILETEGHKVYGIGIPQVTNQGKQTITAVLTKPDIEYKDVYKNLGEIQQAGKNSYSEDGGETFETLKYPQSINSSRVFIRYGDKGGADKDGVMEIRRGVEDLDLGKSSYAQVRILVDEDRYLKGMAMYSDDIPDGCDIVFNTNKKSSIAPRDVMKKITDDPDNPFGAYIKAGGQRYYDDPNGKYTDPKTGKKQSLSAINKLKEEGDWDDMAKNLSSQFLSKQPKELIKKQLNLTYADAEAELAEINSYTNPTIKKKLLLDFASTCDGAAIHLKAAALPRQRTQVILPLTKMPDTEVYAPNYNDGEQVALIRYPHGGTFEIPILKVNNKNKSAVSILGPHIRDAIGINPKVAERLSGADFDGDTVMVIPLSEKVRIQSTKALDGLIGFNPKEQYAYKPGMKVMTKSNTQKQMGVVSNLITDMTLKGANEQEITRAVKHSMVVIDAEKHKLDYVQSEKDNGIKELQKRYQGYTNDDGKEVGGASTLLSRRKQTVLVPERKGAPKIDPDTGKVYYTESGRTYKDPKTGETILAKSKVPLLGEIDDARSLSSGTVQEEIYAAYANKMKSLANNARKESIATKGLVYEPSARQTYSFEVDSLEAKLNKAITNAPKERRAQVIANTIVKGKKQDNPGLDKKTIKKISQIAINNARLKVGANGKNSSITITDREWEAIQHGAITDTKLTQILKYTDSKAIRERAMPKTVSTLSKPQINKVKAMYASGYTNQEIADALGKSISTIYNYINE